MHDTWGDHADIGIRTDNTEARNALWEFANEAEIQGDTGFQLTEDMKKSSLAEAHQIWIIVNDAAKTGLLLAGIYRTLKPFAKKSGGLFSLKIDGALKISRDDQNKLREIGCEISIVRDVPEACDDDSKKLEDGRSE